jgi:hypothetical protein
MDSMTPRKMNALVLMGIGVLLVLSIDPLNKTFAGGSTLVLAGINSLSVPGLVLFVLGAYRFASKGKSS